MESFIEVLIRWVHFVAGITWIGILYFFNLVNVNFMKTLDAQSCLPPWKNLASR